VKRKAKEETIGYYSAFRRAISVFGVRTRVLLTRSPLIISIRRLDVIATSSKNDPFDLHALSTPPAFILDQDQILFNKGQLQSCLDRAPCNQSLILGTTKKLSLPSVALRVGGFTSLTLHNPCQNHGSSLALF
jgi:hypothetical protein